MNEFIARYLNYPLWELFSSRHAFVFYRQLKSLEASQWKGRKYLQALKNYKLRHLVSHAYKNVPYYHHLMKRLKIKPDNVVKEEDLQKLPILTKDIIRKNINNLVARNYGSNSYYASHTGGSTGKVLNFYRDKTTHEFNLAVNRRFWRWARYDIGTKVFYFVGSPYDMKQYDTFRVKFHNILINQVNINAFNMSDDLLDEYSLKMARFKPKILHGYANAIYLFAKHLDNHKMKFEGPTAVITTSEKLYPYQRKFIENFFGCDVFEEYGCREMDLIAHECPAHDGMHVASEKYVFEVLDSKNHPVVHKNGYAVITDLNNCAMPLIRYMNEDMTSRKEGECSCGRQLERISGIEGRTTDFLSGQNGRIVSGVAVTTYLSKVEGIQEFRVVQNIFGKIEILVVPAANYTDKVDAEIRKFMARYLGDNAQLKIKKVKQIPFTKSGKRRTVINESRHII